MVHASMDRERLRRMLFYAAVLLIGYLAFRIFQPFLQSLAWAGLIAISVFPLFCKAARRIGPHRAALLVTSLVAILLILSGVFLGTVLVGEGSKAYSAVQTALLSVEQQEKTAQWIGWSQAHLPLPSVEEITSRVLAIAGRVTGWIVGQAGSITKGVSLFFFNLFLSLFALYFFLRDSDRLAATIRSLLPFESARSEQLIAQTRNLICAGVTTTLTLASAQGFAGGCIFLAMGFEAPVFWAVVMAFCSLVPIVGSSIVWLPTAFWLIFAGHWIKGLVLIALGIGVIGMLDNLLRPLLMSGRTTMNGLMLFISLLGGVAAFGLIGLVLGPVAAAALVSLLNAFSKDAEEA